MAEKNENASKAKQHAADAVEAEKDRRSLFEEREDDLNPDVRVDNRSDDLMASHAAGAAMFGASVESQFTPEVSVSAAAHTAPQRDDASENSDVASEATYQPLFMDSPPSSEHIVARDPMQMSAVDEALFSNSIPSEEVDSFDAATGSVRKTPDYDLTVATGSDTAETASPGAPEKALEEVYFVGTEGDDVITANGLDNFIDGRGGDDVLDGADGDDEIAGGAGDDTIIGGEGNDVAVYSGSWSDYTITESGGTYTIVDNRPGSPDGTDTVTGVETFRFANGEFAAADILNDDPTGLNLSATAVTENDAGAIIGSVSASDADAPLGDTLIYSVNDARFEVVGGQLKLKDGQSLDREAEGATLTLTITATDVHGVTSSQIYTLSIGDVDEFDVSGPVDGDGAANAVSEAASNGDAVGIDVSAADADATTNSVSYNLSDDAGGRFTIDNDGVVTVTDASLLNYEDATSHTIKVTATSADGSTATQSFTISVADVAETLNVSGTFVDTGVAETSITGSAGADDITLHDDGGTVDAGAGDDTITGGTGADIAVYSGAWSDYTITESGGTYTITDTRPGSPDGTDTVTGVETFRFADGDVAVADVLNDAPADLDLSAAAVTENDAGAVIGTLTTTDADAGDSFAYAVDDARFEVVGGQLKLKDGQSLDREADGATVDVKVTVTDAAGAAYTETFTLNIGDVDEFDVIAVSDNDAKANSVSESASNGDAVGITASANDADGSDAITYSLSNDAGGRFQIDPTTGVVTVADASLLNYESNTSHSIEVKATSTDGSTSTQSYTIAIDDAAEDLSVSGTFLDTGVAETSITGSSGVDNLTAHADGGNLLGGNAADTLTGAAGDDRLTGGHGHDAIDGGGGTDTVVFLGNRNDYVINETAPGEFTVRDVTSGKNEMTDTVVNVERFEFADGVILASDPTLVDDDLTITSGNQWISFGTGDDVAQGGTNDDTFSGGDGDDTFYGGNQNDTLSGDAGYDKLYGQAGSDTLEGGDGDDILDGGAGMGTDVAIFSGAWSDYTITESSGTYTITDTRPGSPDGTDTVSNIEIFRFTDGDVAVADVLNDAPTDLDLSAAAVTENDAGAVIGTLTTTDADAGDSFAYAVDDARFEVVGGQLKLKDGQSLDREADGATVDVKVTVTDAAGAAYAETFTLNIGDVDEFDVSGPVDGDGAANAVSEAASNGDAVGIDVSAADADATTNSVSYNLSDDAGGRFTIDNDGVVTVADASLLNYEDATSHTIKVTATSADGSTSTQSFTIAVADAAEALNVSGTFVDAGVAETSITGSAGADDITLHDDGGTVDAGAGDDTITGGTGDDVIAGGTGTDTAVYEGDFADYTITMNADGSFTITDGDLADGLDEGTDTVSGVETFRFNGVDYSADQMADAAGLSAPIASAVSASSVGADEMRLNTYTTGTQADAELASLSDGGFVAVWKSNGQDGDGGGLFAQRYDADGVAQGGEIQVNTGTIGNQEHAEVVGLANGGFVVVWETDDGAMGAEEDVRAQIFDASGTPVGGEIVVNTTDYNYDNNASVAALEDGGFMVVWEADSAGGDVVRAQRFDAAGASVGGEFDLSTGNSNVSLVSVAVLGDGSFVAVWDENNGSNDDVVMQRFQADGALIGSETVVAGGVDDQDDPQVIALEGGGYAVVYEKSGTGGDGDGNGVFVQTFDASGVAQSGEIQVNTTTAGAQQDPIIAARPDGGFTIAWEAENIDGDGYATAMQSFGADGTKIGGEETVSQSTGGDQTNTAITILNDGKVVVAYNGGATEGVVARIFDVNVDENSASGTVVATLGDDGFAATPNSFVITDAGGSPITDANFEISGNQIVVKPGAALDYEAASSKTLYVKAVYDDFESPIQTITIAIGDVAETLNVSGTFVDTGVAETSIIGSAVADDITLHDDGGTVDAGAGDDTITGGTGADTLTGGAGSDTIDGGGGVDIAVFAGSALDYDVALSGNDLIVTHKSTGDVDTLTSIEQLKFDDRLESSSNVNTQQSSVNILTFGSGDNFYHGGGGDDDIDGGAGADWLLGGDDNDVLTGGAGDDLLDGGAGTDTAYFSGDIQDYTFTINADGRLVVTDANVADGDDGTDTLEAIETLDFNGATYDISSLIDGQDGYESGTSGIDFLVVNKASGGTLLGLEGSDVLAGSAGDDSLQGESISGDAGTDLYLAGAGADTMYIGDGGDTVYAGTGDDTIYIRDTSLDGAKIYGGDGTDEIQRNGSNFTIYSDTTVDSVEVLDAFSSTFGMDLNLSGAGSFDLSSVTTLIDINTIAGDGSNQVVDFSGLTTGATFDLGGGEDALTAGAGDDVIDGGTGNDTVFFTGDISDYSVSLSGADVVVTDTVGGRDGTDTLSNVEFVNFNGVTYTLMAGTGSADTLTGSDSTSDLIVGGDGADTLNGGDGKDALFGGSGNDILYAGWDNGDGNHMDGGSGTDTYVINGAGSDGMAYNIDLSTGADQYGNTYVSIENITGGSGDETFTGDAGVNVLDGGEGDDTIDGGAGNDIISGGDGVEMLINGDFEADDVATYDHLASITGWTATNGYLELNDNNDLGMSNVASSGEQFTELDATSGAVEGLYQDVSTDAGEVYTLNFDVAARSSTSLATNTVEVYWNGALVASIDPASASWESYTFEVVGTGGSDRLSFSETAGDDDAVGALIDSVSLLSSGGDDQLTGGAGDDIIKGGAGDDVIDGGAGADTAVFSGEKSDFALSFDGNTGEWSITDTDTADRLDEGTDTLINIEAIEFSDGTVAFDQVIANLFSGEIAGTSSGETLTGTSGDDVMLGFDGSDVFDVVASSGDDYVHGGSGASWTDQLNIEGDSGSVTLSISGSTATVGNWTIQLDEGSFDSSTGDGASGTLTLSNDSSGYVDFGDGDRVAFDELESIAWSNS